jgi:leader peptidase (prepilin peptidase) / N-methyltransferase
MDFGFLTAWYAANHWYSAILVTVLGLCTGSFLNVCIYRIPNGLLLRTPPSHCPACKARLAPLELVPVLSWLWLRGKCRHCSKPISPRYLFVELLTGALFLLCWWRMPDIWRLMPALILTSVLIVAAFIDAEHTIIPNGLALFGAVAGIVLVAICTLVTGAPPWLAAAEGPVPWYRALSGAAAGVLVGGGSLLLLDIISRLILRKDGMGGGDVKLMAMAGLYLGGPATLVALMLAVVAGGLAGIVLLAAKRLKRGDYFPFGPFLAGGAFASMLFAGNILQLYSDFNRYMIGLIVR